MMTLKNAVLGWLLIGGMVLYALALTAFHAGRRVVGLFEPGRNEDSLSASHQ